ncbi:GEVED domain-containing protein [Flavobacterium sp. K77]|uniref:GEVED domain-containing protein n=1 Tax=Flavobacterium sp. K77 TaxID=2910676 RepID=UPI001F18AA3E|nr:GEVED domain-containing protein [Flavobacterium sp. K77]MCF6142284.1 GEVED domain-containing protein [Flavobacterium sp. K77]
MEKKYFSITNSYLIAFFFFVSLFSFGQSIQTFNSSGTFTVPCGVTSITVQVWGAGGGGDRNQSRGGGGGAFAQSTLNVSEGNSFAVTIGQGGAAGTGANGGDSTFGTLVIARGGNGGNGGNNAGRGGQGSSSVGDITFSGGDGGTSTGNGGAGGGAGAGRINNGANGGNTTTGTGANGGTGTNGGGNGGNGGGTNGSGSVGVVPGGGGGERGRDGNNSGGGGNGRVVITYISASSGYCTPSFDTRVDPITNVTFAGINNTTSNTLGGSSLEIFCNTGSVVQGSAINAISVKGNTAGNYTDFYKVYIDWDQNGVFGNNANEITDIGTITNSTGVDAKILIGNVTVPATAVLGTTRMRVIKVFNFNTINPCFTGAFYGQAEDYNITVTAPCPIYSLTNVSAVSTACTTNKTSLVTLNGSAASLPIGSYTVTYSLSINSNAISYTAPMTVTTAGTGQFTADLGIMLANNATTITISNLASGSCSTTLSSGNISNLINILPPITLTLGTVTQPTCAVPTGSVQLSGLPAGSRTIIANPDTGGLTNLTGTGTTATIGGLVQGTTYTFSVSNGTCNTLSAPVVVNSLETTTFNGVGWNSGTGVNKIGTITAGNASPILLTANTELCSCTISPNTNVIVNPGVTLKLQNQLTVNPLGSITFENASSLVQVNDAAVNSGVINYKRITSVVRKASDYTYWSSPVIGQNLLAVSPNTNLGRFWSFVPGGTWFVETPSTKIMDVAKGYIIRAPEFFPGLNPPSSTFVATFSGAPNNGVKTIAVGGPGTFNLIGNPYPSAIDAIKFLNANSTVLGGTIYFWTHNTEIRNKVGTLNEGSGDLVYIQDDYASFNRTGGVGTVAISDPDKLLSNPNIPNGMIAAGQSFFTTSIAAAGTPVTFNNDMRIGTGYLNNSQFFRTKETEKVSAVVDRSRIWLNLTNKQNAFKQTLVGYIDGATNDFDAAFDGPSFNANAIINFYSVNKSTNYVIQGRALPFEQNDLVPLGYSSTIDGEFSISIDNLDGLFTTQNVFLEDKNTNTIHNLKTSPYSFQTTKGTFNDRFVLRYTDKTLGVEDVITDFNTVLVTVKNKQLKVTAGKEDINSVVIYSILGKQIYFKKDIANKELVIENLPSSDQVLIVKTVLEDGTLYTTKTIFK